MFFLVIFYPLHGQDIDALMPLAAPPKPAPSAAAAAAAAASAASTRPLELYGSRSHSKLPKSFASEVRPLFHISFGKIILALFGVGALAAVGVLGLPIIRRRLQTKK